MGSSINLFTETNQNKSRNMTKKSRPIIEKKTRKQLKSFIKSRTQQLKMKSNCNRITKILAIISSRFIKKTKCFLARSRSVKKSLKLKNRIKITCYCIKGSNRFSGKIQRKQAKTHQNSFSNIRKSNICYQKFTQYSSWQKHLRVHTGEKPYKCHYENCDKTFTQISNQKRHEQIHTNNQKPFDCPICMKRFSSSSNLKQHQLTHEQDVRTANILSIINNQCIEKTREQFRCDHKECDKQYLYPSSLKKHQKQDHDDQSQFDQIIQKFNDGDGENIILDHSINNEFFSNHESEQSLEAEDDCCQESHKKQEIMVESNNHESECGGKDCSDFIERLSREKQIQIHHQGHIDLLFMGYLYHFNQKTNQIEIHELETMQEFEMETEQKQKSPKIEGCNPVSQLTHNQRLELQIKLETLQTKFPTKDFLSNEICSTLLCQCSGGKNNKVCKICNGNQGNQENVTASQQEESNCEKQEDEEENSGCCSKKNNASLKKNQAQNDLQILNMTSGNTFFTRKLSIPNIFEELELQRKGEEIDQNSSNDSQQQGKNEEVMCFCQETLDMKHQHGPLCGHAQIIHDGHVDYIVENTLHHPHQGHCDYHGKIKIHRKMQNVF